MGASFVVFLPRLRIFMEIPGRTIEFPSDRASHRFADSSLGLASQASALGTDLGIFL